MQEARHGSTNLWLAMQGTLRIEFPGGYTLRTEHREGYLPHFSGSSVLALLHHTYQQMIASCPAVDPEGALGQALFGAEASLQVGDATLPSEIVQWLRTAMERPDAVLVRRAFKGETLLLDSATSLSAPLSLPETATDAETADLCGLLDRLARLTRWLPGTDTPLRLRVRWQEPGSAETPARDMGTGKESRSLIHLQRRLYRQHFFRVLETTATEAARRAVGVPRTATLQRVHQLLAVSETWRDTLRTGLSDGDGALRFAAREELRRATVGGNHLLNVLRLLPDLKQTPGMGEAELATAAGARIVRAETARRLWIEARESDEALLWFADRLLHALTLRSRGEELPAPEEADTDGSEDMPTPAEDTPAPENVSDETLVDSAPEATAESETPADV